jgi:hypothetical protein
MDSAVGTEKLADRLFLTAAACLCRYSRKLHHVRCIRKEMGHGSPTHCYRRRRLSIFDDLGDTKSYSWIRATGL